VEKNTCSVLVSVRVGYGCHPRIKNHPRTRPHRVRYPYPNCHPYSRGARQPTAPPPPLHVGASLRQPRRRHLRKEHVGARLDVECLSRSAHSRGPHQAMTLTTVSQSVMPLSPSAADEAGALVGLTGRPPRPGELGCQLATGLYKGDCEILELGIFLLH
jgi:hypothetical protein